MSERAQEPRLTALIASCIRPPASKLPLLLLYIFWLWLLRGLSRKTDGGKEEKMNESDPSVCPSDRWSRPLSPFGETTNGDERTSERAKATLAASLAVQTSLCHPVCSYVAVHISRAQTELEGPELLSHLTALTNRTEVTL